MKFENSRFCSIDIETTGLNIKKDEIVSFACVPIINLRILVRDFFYTIIKPKNYRIEAMKYHGISNNDLIGAPAFEEVADRILQRLDGILLGHSVEFDYSFLKRYFKTLRMNLNRDILDIALVEKWLGQKRGCEGLDLTFEAMMERYKLRQYYRHNAAADAFFAAQIFQMQVPRLVAAGVDSVDQTIKLAKSCRYEDHGFVF